MMQQLVYIYSTGISMVNKSTIVFLYELLHFSDCQRVRNPRRSNTQDVTVNYSSLD